MVNSDEPLRCFSFVLNTSISWYLTFDVVYMRFKRTLAVHHYSKKLGMIRHTDFVLIYNETIVDVNISPSFPEENEMGLLSGCNTFWQIEGIGIYENGKPCTAVMANLVPRSWTPLTPPKFNVCDHLLEGPYKKWSCRIQCTMHPFQRLIKLEGLIVNVRMNMNTLCPTVSPVNLMVQLRPHTYNVHNILMLTSENLWYGL